MTLSTALSGKSGTVLANAGTPYVIDSNLDEHALGFVPCELDIFVLVDKDSTLTVVASPDGGMNTYTVQASTVLTGGTPYTTTVKVADLWMRVSITPGSNTTRLNYRVLIREDARLAGIGSSGGGGAAETLALADLSDVTGKTGTGATVVMSGSPVITTPTIASFVNAPHDHTNAAGGGKVPLTGITAGTMATTGSANTINVVDATGNIGLSQAADGTSKLAINGRFQVESGTAGHLYLTRSGLHSWIMYIDGSSGFSLNDVTAAAIRFIINSAGEAGIGPNASTLTGYTLRVDSGSSGAIIGVGSGNILSFTNTADCNLRINLTATGAGTKIATFASDFAEVFSFQPNTTESLKLGAGTIGFLGAAASSQQTSGANLTNSVTSGGTNDTITNWTDLTLYANDAAAIRNAVYQLARKLKQVNDALRLYGLLS